jgi:hypothetical protein
MFGNSSGQSISGREMPTPAQVMSRDPLQNVRVVR